MKLICLFTCLLVLPIASFGQKGTPELPIIDGKIVYTEVVNIDSTKTKNELYSKAREWFAKTYNSSIKVIQMDDKEDCKIIGKALFQVYHKAMKKDYPSGNINYTISIFAKDGRYKYEITGLYHTGSGNTPGYGACEGMINTKMKTMGISYQKTFNYYLWQMDDYVKDIIVNLKASMINITEQQDDNW